MLATLLVIIITDNFFMNQKIVKMLGDVLICVLLFF